MELTALVRMLQSAFRTDEEQLLQKIALQEAKIAAIVSLSDAETLNHLRDLEQPIHRVADQMTRYARTLEDERYRKILDWISLIHYSEQQKRYSEGLVQGSGEWLLRHPKYLDWLSSSSSSTLLLHGMAGSGKTSLASVVVNSILQRSGNQTSPLPVAYFYCSKNVSESELRDSREIMCSIVRQLSVNSGARQTIHSAVVNEYERREAESKVDGFDAVRLSLQDCVRLILNITGPNPATIVVDAVDEVQPACRHELIEALEQISRHSESVVKFFVTTREDDQVFSIITDASRLRIDVEKNRKDIQSLVSYQVTLAIKKHRLLGGAVSKKLQAELSQALIDGAGEM